MGAWRDIDTVPNDKDILVIGGQWYGEIHGLDNADGAYLVHHKDGLFPVKGTDGYSSYILDPTHWHPVPMISVA